MKIVDTNIDEVKIIVNDIKDDIRGPKYNTYSYKEYKKNGLEYNWVLEKIYNPLKKGTLYGIHYQNNPKAQTKLVTCIKGSGIDYAIDLRINSKTYLKYVSVLLDDKSHQQLLIPKGFGHAFLSLEDDTILSFKVDEEFDSNYTVNIRYDDPSIGIKYPLDKFILASHDINSKFVENCEIIF